MKITSHSFSKENSDEFPPVDKRLESEAHMNGQTRRRPAALDGGVSPVIVEPLSVIPIINGTQGSYRLPIRTQITGTQSHSIIFLHPRIVCTAFGNRGNLPVMDRISTTTPPPVNLTAQNSNKVTEAMISGVDLTSSCVSYQVTLEYMVDGVLIPTSSSFSIRFTINRSLSSGQSSLPTPVR